MNIAAGRGGDGLKAGGKGGALTLAKVTLHGDFTDDVTLAAGSGGNVTGATGVGGLGGSALGLTLTTNGIGGDIALSAGASGESRGTVALKGGSLLGATVQNLGKITGSATFTGGAGGKLGSGSGKAGAGGDIGLLNYTNFGGVDGALVILSGAPGVNAGSGSGGGSGNTGKVVVTTYSEILGSKSVGSASGGNASAAGNGGSSGNVSEVTFADHYGVAGTVAIAAGGGGSGVAAGSKGGNTGAISKITLNGMATSFGIGRFTSAVSGGSGDLAGGNGGAISAVTGSVGRLFITAADGGAASASTGNGGSGGSIVGVTMNAVSDFVRIIAAGDGGAGGANASGGAGGSVSLVKVAGDIGDFSAAFDVTSITSGQGGVVAGRGGAGLIAGRSGSVTGVTSDRIATIIAGKTAANALTSANAVFAISGILTSAIGADLDGDGTFDFTNTVGTAAFDLGDSFAGTSDTPIDGLVLVRVAGAGVLPVMPLKLVKV